MNEIIRVLKVARRKIRNKAIILMYHRVNHLENDVNHLAITPEKFEAQIKFLKKNFPIISLQELLEQLKKGRVINNFIVITFDDGYYDNYKYAFPILTDYNIPASFFITAGKIDSGLEFWWDYLQRIVFNEKYNGVIEIEINNKIYKSRGTNNKERTKYFEIIFNKIKDMDFDERFNLIKDLLNRYSISTEARENYRVMTKEEIKKMDSNKLISINSHGMSHKAFSEISTEEKKWEVDNSKNILENIVGHKVSHFAFPFGATSDIDIESPEIVKECGYDCALVGWMGFVYNNSNPYWLPRWTVGNWNLLEFKERLNHYKNISINEYFLKKMKKK